MRASDTTGACACGSGRAYAACCEPFHAGGEPPDPVALVRSRYTAFVVGAPDYLVRTLHRDHDDLALSEGELRARLRANAKRTRYHGLAVLDQDGPDADGTYRVLFRVEVSYDAKDASFVELSSFVHDGHGLRYVGGITFAARTAAGPSTIRIADVERR